MIEFNGFPKIARLFRDVLLTEKLDGSNAAVGIEVVPCGSFVGQEWPGTYAGLHYTKSGEVDGSVVVYAQSRNRLIHPGMDNYGFARWVWDNAEALVNVLGPGLHFGEWWGSGIQRGYGLPKGEKRFSLFNTNRWSVKDQDGMLTAPLPELSEVPGLGVVPVLYQGPFSTHNVRGVLRQLELYGSQAAPGFMNPEGVVIYHTAANTMFKATIHGDEQPKSATLKAVADKPRAFAVDEFDFGWMQAA